MPLVNLSGDSWYCQEEITVECCIFSLSRWTIFCCTWRPYQ